MAFGAHGLEVGDPMKKSAADQLQENEERNRDRINGDDAFSHSETGHDHTGSGDGVPVEAGGLANGAVDTAARIAAGIIVNTRLKTTTQEVSTASAANILLSSIGSYGFYPCQKTTTGNVTCQFSSTYAVGVSYVHVTHMVPTGGGTAFVQVRYIQASRPEPVVWLLREKATGFLISSVFDPETGGDTHPFADYLEGGIPADKEVIVIELNRSKELSEHLYKNFGRTGSFLDQIHLGLLAGVIIIDKTVEPLTKSADDNYRPCMYGNDVNVKDFKYIEQE